MVSETDDPIEAQSGTKELYVEHPEPNVINATTIKILIFFNTLFPFYNNKVNLNMLNEINKINIFYLFLFFKT